jgi:hypothetical protein
VGDEKGLGWAKCFCGVTILEVTVGGMW